MTISSDFYRALEIGRPPNIQRLFPNSKALIVSGKVIDRAMIAKGGAMTIAANGRNTIVIRGTLAAAQRANAAVIIEIAKSESNYCPVSMWNIATIVDAFCNEMGITVPVAVHADHFAIKSGKDLESAVFEIPSIFDAGITSIAIDASHLIDDENLKANIKLNKYIPSWAGYETEVGEIKGKEGLSTPDEALFLIKGLNAHRMYPDWIALNNGTTHGIEESDAGINVELTREIHQAIEKYGLSGAQHGTSGNSLERLKKIAGQTNTTKANVATALQMIAWGVKVNEYGNALMDENKKLIKLEEKGLSDGLWKDMTAYAEKNSIKAGDFKKLNLPFENRFLAQPKDVRDRMASDVEEFVYDILVNSFNAKDTADLAIDAILEAGSYDLGPKGTPTEDPAEWTEEKYTQRAKTLHKEECSIEGNFDD